jgi:hypothetical protein
VLGPFFGRLESARGKHFQYGSLAVAALRGYGGQITSSKEGRLSVPPICKKKELDRPEIVLFLSNSFAIAPHEKFVLDCHSCGCVFFDSQKISKDFVC